MISSDDSNLSFHRKVTSREKQTIFEKVFYCSDLAVAMIRLVIFLCIGSPLILCKKQEPVCVQPLDGVAAYPCESRPTREPLSLQYSKAQS